jgi:archaellum component FlaF (FlaF/FlaG flagellin family)
MESSSHSRLRHRMALLATLPVALIGFGPATAAADEGPSAETSINSSEQDNSSGPATSPDTEPTEEPVTTEGPGAVKESSPRDEASSSGETGTPASTNAADETTSEPTVEQGSPEATRPGARVPKAAAPSQAPGSQRAKPPEHKFTICHRTRSSTNPYNQITVDRDSLVKQGHLTHTGPIFSPGLDRWGDIIPPVPPEVPDGMNWPEGAPILNNGCEVPPPPDVGPLPEALIGTVACVGTVPNVDVKVTNGADATAPANFEILVDGVVVQTVGPVAPGDSQTVTLTGDADGLQEDATITVEVRSPPGGDVIATQVLTVDCAAPPPDVDVTAQLECVGEVARGSVTVTNNGQQPVTVTATVDGAPAGTPLVVAAGATETATADLSAFEGQTITVAILVDGNEVATYTGTVDCVAPQANPSVSVAGEECPPPSTTVTLGNTGDPDSQVVFVILVDGKVVQRTAPLFGGDTTTIVGDLSRFEDQTVAVELRANGKVLGSRTIHVNCTTVAGAQGTAQPGSTTGSGVLPASGSGAGVLPVVGAGFGPGVIALGLGLLIAGSLLLVVGSRRSGSRQA